MQFSFTDEQVMIANTVNAFFAENATSERTRAAMSAHGFDQNLWQAFCAELGLAGATLPEEFGGADLGMVEQAIIAEAAGAQLAAIPLLGLSMSSAAILAGGDAAQKSRWIAGIASGETIAVYGDASSARVQEGTLTATLDRVPHGAIADCVVVNSADGVWLVETDAAGVTIAPLTTMDQTRPFATVTLANAVCTPLIDPEAAREAAAAAGSLCLAAEALGGAQVCLDRTVAFAKDRVQFGRAIGSFQAYKHRLADLMVLVEQARSAVYWAACAMNDQSGDQALALHAAKAFCSDTFFKCAADMIQLHGGIGFTWEHDAHLFFKRARAIQMLGGNGDWHREQVAALILDEAA